MGKHLQQVSVGAIVGVVVGVISAALTSLLAGPDTVALLGGSAQPPIAWGVHALNSAVMGGAFAILFMTAAWGGYAEQIMGGLTLGVLMWLVITLMALPIATASGPRWTASAAAQTLPALVSYLLQGVLLGVASRRFVPTVQAAVPAAPSASAQPLTQRRVVILGGGFAGVTTAQQLERLFGNEPDVEIVLVSDTNHLLFTPMLSEVAAGGVEAPHITPALRAFFRKVRVVRGTPVGVDLSERTVTVETGASVRRAYAYEHLVLALGAVPNFYGNQQIGANALTFKSLEDAIHIRNHVIAVLERADTEPNAGLRKGLLTFVVVGGGFAGTELIGSLNDFIRGSLWYYPNIPPEEVSLILVHPGERILPEVSESLAQYAQEKMAARGVSFWLKTRVTDAAPGSVTMDGEVVATQTLIWTAGNTPHPFLGAIEAERDKRGAILTDERLSAKGAANLWALGDCAQVPDLITGKTCPPTAQHALRQAKTAAYNIHAAMHGNPPKAFKFRAIGSLAVLGHLTAVAELRGFRFSGMFAWLLWRGVYLVKLPTLEKRVRVLIDWIVDIFFPRDIGSIKP
jgi:NADH dehydrogenase